jgi:hypothetical protein
MDISVNDIVNENGKFVKSVDEEYEWLLFLKSLLFKLFVSELAPLQPIHHGLHAWQQYPGSDLPQ